METNIADVFNAYPDAFRKPLLKIREMIYTIQARLPQTGHIEESLKWGQPTYSTVSPKSGTPIRLDRLGEDKIGVFFHCQTSLVDSFRTMFPEGMEFSGNRAIVLDPQEELPESTLALCIEMALTYHLKKGK